MLDDVPPRGWFLTRTDGRLIVGPSRQDGKKPGEKPTEAEKIRAGAPLPFVVDPQPRQSRTAETESDIQKTAPKSHLPVCVRHVQPGGQRRKGKGLDIECPLAAKGVLCGWLTLEHHRTRTEIPGGPPAIGDPFTDLEESGRTFESTQIDPVHIAFGGSGQVCGMEVLAPSVAIPDQDAERAYPIMFDMAPALVVTERSAKAKTVEPGRGVELQRPGMDNPVRRRLRFIREGSGPEGPACGDARTNPEITSRRFESLQTEEVVVQ
jgi:hypothetical protein